MLANFVSASQILDSNSYAGIFQSSVNVAEFFILDKMSSTLPLPSACSLPLKILVEDKGEEKSRAFGKWKTAVCDLGQDYSSGNSADSTCASLKCTALKSTISRMLFGRQNLCFHL